MKSSNSFLLLILLTVVLIIMLFSGCSRSHSESVNQALERKSGLEDKVLTEYYKDEIQAAHNDIFPYEYIRIDYYDADLNSDGLIDKIVVLDSFLYSGTAGELFDILISNDNGSFTDVSKYILQLLGQLDSIPDAEFFISDVKAYGFSNIIIKHQGELQAELEYDGEQYNIID